MTNIIDNLLAAQPGELMASITVRASASSAEIAAMLVALNAGQMTDTYSLVGRTIEMRRASVTDIPFDHPSKARLH